MDQKQENWKCVQDQPQFSNPNSRCLHCTGDHRSQDCPTRHQYQVPPTNNPIGNTGIPFQYSPHVPHPSPPQYSQQSVSTDGSSTPILMVNNPEQFNQGPIGQQAPVAGQQDNQQVRPSVPQQINQPFNQYMPTYASPLFLQPHFNPQYPPPYPGQSPLQSPSVQSNISETRELIM